MSNRPYKSTDVRIMHIYGNAEQVNYARSVIKALEEVGVDFDKLDNDSIKWISELHGMLAGSNIVVLNDGRPCIDYGVISMYELVDDLGDCRVSSEVSGYKMIDYSLSDEHYGFILFYNIVVSTFWMEKGEIVLDRKGFPETIFRSLLYTLRE